jgi:MFS family permease
MDAVAGSSVAPAMPSRATRLLLNAAHALDHLFLLIFAAAVAAIAADFGAARWEDLMPWGAGAFALFALGSLPAGRLGDLWGRRPMMLLFFFGAGAAALLVACARSPWQIGLTLTVLGAFCAIYHPIGIPMLVRHAERPGLTIGINGLAGNLGVALSALLTGLLVKYAGWRAAFVVPGLLSIACGALFARVAREDAAPARQPGAASAPVEVPFARLFAVMTIASVTGNLLFNVMTNGNAELLRERFVHVIDDPALLGALLAAAYALASLAQIAVGHMIDRVPLKLLYAGIVAVQAPLFALAASAQGWALYLLMAAFMITIFGAIPFTDAMIVRYVADSHRSRVSGMRMTVALGASSLAVWLLGPAVKAAGFRVLLLARAVISLLTLAAVRARPGAKAAAPRAVRRAAG